MVEIFHDPVSKQVRIRYTQGEIHAYGVIDTPGHAELAIDENGSLGNLTKRLIAHLSDITDFDDDGASLMLDGIYEITSQGMHRLGPLLDREALSAPLVALEQPFEIPVDASELAG